MGLMDTEAIRLDVHVTAWPHTPSSDNFTNVIIKQDREFEEFLRDGNDDSVTSLGSYRDPSPSDPPIHLNIRDFQPNHVYQLLHSQLHNRVLSEHIADQIVAEAQKQTSQSFDDLPQQLLFVVVFVKLTLKVYTFVPRNSGPLVVTDSDQENPCPICLESLSEDYCQLPNCPHCFHESCVYEWLNRYKNNSCPLCRQPINI